MDRLSRLLTCMFLLACAMPVLAQSTDANSTPPQARVPAPPETATADELELQGDNLRSQKLYLDCIDYYRAALTRRDTAILHNKIGIAYLQLQRNSDARKAFQEAIKRDHNYPEAYNNLGVLHYKNQKYGSAIREYRKAIKLSDLNASFHSNLGTAYFAQKDFERATKEMSRALELDPSIFENRPSGGVAARLVSANDLGRFHYMMAQMYGQKGDVEHCRYYLSKANEDGYSVRDALKDSVFADLRKDPSFVTFVRSLKVAPSDNN
jgi:tetratricopeptide (TPR) repeat protein